MRKLAVFLLPFLTPALAQVTPELFMPEPTEWLKRTHQLVTGYGLPAAIEGMAYALLVALFAYGAVRATYHGNGGELAGLFGRLFLAGAVLMLLSPIRELTQNTWVSTYNWSNNIWANDLGPRLQDASLRAGLLTAPFFGVNAVMRGGTSMAGLAAQAGGRRGMVAGAGSNIVGRAAQYMQGVMLLFVPLFGLYAALIYISGLTVLMAVLFLPFSGVLLLLPNGASWASRWVAMYCTAIFTVVFLPIVFGIVIDIGMVQPVERMADHMQSAMEKFEAASGTLKIPELSGNPIDSVSIIGNWLQSIPDGVWTSFQGFAILVLGWLASLVALLAGMLVGAYLLMNMERYVTGFMGGVAGSSRLPGSGPVFFGGGGAKQVSSRSGDSSSSAGSTTTAGGGGGSASTSGGGGGSASTTIHRQPSRMDEPSNSSRTLN